MSLAQCTFQLEVREVELSEESEEKERKVAAQRRVAQSRVVLRVNVAAHGHVVALEGRACALACASLREACARFCPWFVKIICTPVTGACLAEL